MTPEQARKNLSLAADAVEKATSRIAELGIALAGEAPDAERLAAELQTARECLARAEEVRATSAVRILQFAVDERAQELVELNIRRQYLLQIIDGFMQMEFVSGGMTRTPEASRAISAALLEQAQGRPAGGEHASAIAAQLRAQLDALLGDPDAPVTISVPA